MMHKKIMVDGNEAAAYIAYRLSEVVAIYPITPASPMGEWADTWSSVKQENIWGTVPLVIEMQSEGGAAGAVHGALQSGALTTTFTASQGLLLMLPNMYKIAGELTSAVFHIAARTVATHALSIFGDHSDVMAARGTGFAMLASNSVQEVMDQALIAHAASLKARIPFLHFFDGFRTSHEIQKIEALDDEIIRKMVDEKWVMAHRQRGLSSDNPFIRGTAQNPDVFFQARETANRFYEACPGIVQESMDQFAALTGRQYRLFEYLGDPEAERVIIVMGSGAEAVEETVDTLTRTGEKVGFLKVRLYRPFSAAHFIQALPGSVQTLAVLDRTKEPGSTGEPLYEDVVSAVFENASQNKPDIQLMPRIIGGRYGLSSKEFTPAMVKGIFEEMKKDAPKNHFTIGINDDVTHTSLTYDNSFSTEHHERFQGLFYGLGADGTVSANKNAIKIIGQNTDFYAQGYFVYDSKKSGAVTTSHLRFGKEPIRSTYLIRHANFIACHQWMFLEKYDVLQYAEPGATLLLNAPYHVDALWDKLPKKIQEQIINKKLKCYTIDAYQVAQKVGLGKRINTIMQTCFFAISGILPRDEAIAHIKEAVRKTYGKKGALLLENNFKAVDIALENLFELNYSDQITSKIEIPDIVAESAPDFVKTVIGKMLAGAGEELPVSAFPEDGTFPSGTSQWEKRNISQEIPVWEEDLCIQCGKCALICPHAVIRIKAYEQKWLEEAPSSFKNVAARGKEWPDNTRYTIQVAPEDCTGCRLCVEICPVKDKSRTGTKALNMAPQIPLKTREAQNWEFFLNLPDYDRSKLKINSVKGSQLLQPLFEFSGACSGCGETPYIKLVTQLFGDRMVVANATGCSSIYGGNLPTTPWTVNSEGRGPAWSNSLFEDNAEFGLGFRVAIDKHREQSHELLEKLRDQIGEALASEILAADQSDEAGIYEQRQRVETLKSLLKQQPQEPEIRRLTSLSDYLVKKSVWIIGGDGWAYDIGFGGLDHVLASGKNVNILVLDTEVYSNTGGQMSKATPLAAVAKFAAGGKQTIKKDLAMQAIGYGGVYVAQVAIGANDTQTIKAFLEAEQYQGPSLIIAYSPCIAHGYPMEYSLKQQKLAVNSAYWPLFRYNPTLKLENSNPFILDSRSPLIPLEEYLYNEARFKILTKMNPQSAKELLNRAQDHVNSRWKMYERMKEMYQSVHVNGGRGKKGSQEVETNGNTLTFEK